jgi:hypothetical protein
MTANVIDFDAYRAEQAEEPVLLKVGGKEYTLPTSLPASIALEIVRMNAAGPDAEVSEAYLERLGRAMFGGDQFVEIIEANNITLKELGPLITMAMAAYGGGEATVTPPNREARRRAKTKAPSISSETGAS